MEHLQTKELTAEEILNFDELYNSALIDDIEVTNKGKKIIKRYYIPNVRVILENKLGDSAFNISQFLTIRRELISDTELVYCLHKMLH